MKKHISFFIVLLVLIVGLPALSFAEAVDLPQTGQTACYDASESVIPCACTCQDEDIQQGMQISLIQVSGLSLMI